MTSLLLITKQLIGLEYELGKLDCFSVIIEYLKISLNNTNTIGFVVIIP